MDIKTFDFHRLCLEDAPEYYSSIYRINKERFNIWIQSKLDHVGSIDSYDSVAPSEKCLAEFSELGYEHEYYRCH